MVPPDHERGLARPFSSEHSCLPLGFYLRSCRRVFRAFSRFLRVAMPTTALYHSVPRIRQLLGVVELIFVTSLRVYISFSAIGESKLLGYATRLRVGSGSVLSRLSGAGSQWGEREKKRGGLDSVYIMIYLGLVPSVACCNAFRFGRIFSLQQKNDKIIYLG